MAPETGEKALSLAEILTAFSAAVAGLGDNFGNLSVLAAVEDDLLRLVASTRGGIALEAGDRALVETLEKLLAQYELAGAQLDLRLRALEAFGAHLKTRLDPDARLQG